MRAWVKTCTNWSAELTITTCDAVLTVTIGHNLQVTGHNLQAYWVTTYRLTGHNLQGNWQNLQVQAYGGRLLLSRS